MTKRAVHFAEGSAELTAEARETLNALARILFSYKTAWRRIHLTAYQDQNQGEAKGRQFAEARMKNISAYLEAEGLARNRLITIVQDSNQPVSALDLAAVRQNRVDIELLEMQGRDSWDLRQALESLSAKQNTKR